MAKIDDIRKAINELDDTLLDAISSRLELMPAVIKYKQQMNLPILDEKREEAVLEKKMRQAQERGMNPAFVEKLYKLIIDESKRIQKGLIGK